MPAHFSFKLQRAWGQANTSAEVIDEVASILEATRARGLQAAGHSGMSWDAATRIAGSFSDALMKLFRGEVRSCCA